MPLTPKEWHDGPAGGTPLDAAALIDAETREGAYTDTEIAALAPATYAPVLSGLGTPTIVDNVGRNVVHLSNDGKYLVANKRTMLRISGNETSSWTDVHDFTPYTVEYLVEMNDGEVLVFTGPSTSEQGRVWRSSGWSWTNPTAATWTQKLASNGTGAYFTRTYGGIFYDYDHGVLLVNEYGNKTGDVAGCARYCYRSTDNGLTFTTIFDRLAYDGIATGKHMHGAAYDAVWDRVWLTLGDDTNAIVYSDDWRNSTPTWQTAQSDASVNGKFQSVAIVPLPNCILFGADGWPNGIHRIRRTDTNGNSTKTAPGAALENAFALNTKTTLSHLFQQPFVARHVANAPLLWGYGPDASAAAAPGGLVVSFDGGLTFSEIWRDSRAYNPDSGFKVAVGPTFQNSKILGTLDDNRQANWSLWTAGLPDRRRSPQIGHRHQHARGSADEIHPGAIRGAWGHHIMATVAPETAGAPTALTANTPRGTRAIVPIRGFLRDLAIFIGTSSGNIDVGIYKETSTGLAYIKSLGTTACPAASSGTWTIVYDPQLEVETGDEYVFMLDADNATATFRTMANSPAVPLPASYNPLGSGATYKRTFVFSGAAAAFPLTTSAVPNAQISGSISTAPLIIGRIDPALP